MRKRFTKNPGYCHSAVIVNWVLFQMFGVMKEDWGRCNECDPTHDLQDPSLCEYLNYVNYSFMCVLILAKGHFIFKHARQILFLSTDNSNLYRYPCHTNCMRSISSGFFSIQFYRTTEFFAHLYVLIFCSKAKSPFLYVESLSKSIPF